MDLALGPASCKPNEQKRDISWLANARNAPDFNGLEAGAVDLSNHGLGRFSRDKAEAYATKMKVPASTCKKGAIRF